MLPAVVRYSAYELHLFHNNNRYFNLSSFFYISQSIAYLDGASTKLPTTIKRTSLSLKL